MANEIERILEERIKGHDHLELLSAQWKFDKQLLSKALQNIIRTFPHYSLHDGSHSETILEQIFRILGDERIRKLSATDLWLLLESAYHHDVGMIISAEEAHETWKSEEFQLFLKESIKWGGDPDIVEASSLLRSESIDSAKMDDWPLKTQWALHIMFAEWFRTAHPTRSARFVDNPENVGMGSPRTLIPKRLFSVLSKVCKAHGQSVEEAMALSGEENGMGTELCHPRFIALMLRLGDLLDLDNGRFCPVTKKAFGLLPEKSAAHDRKHESIRHFLVTPQKIEVHALCHDYDAYFATEEWLDTLQKELEHMSTRWADITPLSDFGSPPGIGRIQAELEGYELLERGKRPRFEVDREAMLEFASGTNLYSDKWTCIRELIQNAIDATLLRAWVDSKSEIQKLEDAPPNEAGPIGLKKILSEYDIQIEIKNLGESKKDAEKIRYRFSIQDQGIGISKEDVHHLLYVGGSGKNRSRQKLIDEMPEWARPSGIFGIGLHSVFPLTDRLTIKTKHACSLEAREIEFISENGREHKTLLRKLEETEAKETSIGTILSFEFEVEKIPPVGNQRPSGAGKQTGELLSGFDPISDEVLTLDSGLIGDAISKYASQAPCVINYSGKKLESDGEESAYEYFHRDTGIVVRLEVGKFSQEIFGTHPSGRGMKMEIPAYSCAVFYRGMPVSESPHLLIPVSVDLYCDSAKGILTANRNTLSAFGKKKLDSGMKNAVAKAAKSFLSGGIDDDYIPQISLAHIVYSKAAIRAEQSAGASQWKEVELRNVQVSDGQSIKLGELCELGSLGVFIDFSRGLMKPHKSIEELCEEFNLPKDEKKIAFADFSLGVHMLEPIFHSIFRSVSFLKGAVEIQYYKFSKDDTEEILTEETFALVIRSADSARSCVRYLVPCRQKYRSLRVREECLEWYQHQARFLFVPHTVVSPLEFRKGKEVNVTDLKRYIEWVNKNKKHDVSLEDIVWAAWRFIDDAAEVLEKPGLRDEAKAILREWVDLTDVTSDRS